MKQTYLTEESKRLIFLREKFPPEKVNCYSLAKARRTFRRCFRKQKTSKRWTRERKP